MAIDDLITRDQAGEILGISGRTVSRYTQKGLIVSFPKVEGSGFRGTGFRIEDVKELKKKILAREELDSIIKELYVLEKTNFNRDSLLKEFEITNYQKIEDALFLYQFEREGILAHFLIKSSEYDNVLLTEEVNARLKLVDGHVVPNLVESGHLEGISVRDNSHKKYFIRIESLMSYLGDYANEFLYRTQTVAKLTGLKINHIDKIACHYGLGFKIKPTEQGNYLFTPGEIAIIPELKRLK